MTLAFWFASAVAVEIATPASAVACKPSRVVTRAVRAYCDRTDGDRNADRGCGLLWEALRDCDPHLTITRRREQITLVLHYVDRWTMVLARDEAAVLRVVEFEWEDCCECPADPWTDPRLGR